MTEKLMTRFTFAVENKEDGCHITVTRLIDNVDKKFFLAGGRTLAVIENFMASITDEQAEGYYPKPKKEKKKLTEPT